MISSEIDKAGIPVTQITTMTSVALMVGVNRILLGLGIIHPLGNAALPRDEEESTRRKLVQKALEILKTPVEAPTVFQILG